MTIFKRYLYFLAISISLFSFLMVQQTRADDCSTCISSYCSDPKIADATACLGDPATRALCVVAGQCPADASSTSDTPTPTSATLTDTGPISFFGLFEANSLPELISLLYKAAIRVVGFLIFIQFLRAGILYVTAAGNSGNVSTAKKLMSDAVIGALILFSAYLILNVINPNLVNSSFAFGVPNGNSSSAGGQPPGGGAPLPAGKTGDLGMTGTCSGAQCSEPDANVCGTTQADCFDSAVGSWNSQIQSAVAKAGSKICGSIDSVGLAKAIMARESNGKIGAVSPKEAYGLMQIKLKTAQTFAPGCGVNPNDISTSWFADPSHAADQICIAIKYLQNIAGGNCGCDVRQIAGGFNGGPYACEESVDCGSFAGVGSGGAGSCSACSGESPTRRWECPWNEPEHLTCNNTLAGNFAETRAYAPRVAYCYGKYTSN